MSVGYRYHLLGVMKGFTSDEEAKQNTGIALVVPVDKIAEILSGDRVKAFVAQMIADDKTTKGDLKAAELKFQESIFILEKLAPESSQLVKTLLDYAMMLQQAKRGEDARVVLTKAQRISDRPVSKAPEP